MPRFLSVTLEVPYDGIADAGGEFVRRHYEMLSSLGHLSVIARRTEQNIRAANDPSPAHLDVSVLPSSRWSSRYLRPVRIVMNALSGLALGREFSGPLLRTARELDLSEFDVIEFHWIEAGQWIRQFRTLAPHARFVLIAHDILSQRRRRVYDAASSPVSRVKAWLRWIAAVAAERRMFPRFDAVAVLSEKDSELVHAVSDRAHPCVLRPWLVPDHELEQVPTRRSNPTVLFTGAMGRPENDDAARWLVRDIWPPVRDAVANARLVIAGAKPSAALLKLAEADPSIEVTGFVDALDPYYSAADVFACPLRFGAGVKFKTIAAQLAGLPVVTTSVGAEGVGGDFAGVTEDAGEFGRMLTMVLSDPEEWRVAARGAQEGARTRFGREAYERASRALLGLPPSDAARVRDSDE